MLGPVVDWYDRGVKPTLRNKLELIIKYAQKYGACGMHAPQSRNKTNICYTRELDNNILELFPNWANHTKLVEEFKINLQEVDTRLISPHGSYLINLASSSNLVRDNSISIVVKQAIMCKYLGLNSLVFHPGSNPNTAVGTKYLLGSITKLEERLPEGVEVCLENLCSKNSMFKTTDQILEVYKHILPMKRVFLCFDTAHYTIAKNDVELMYDTMNFLRPKIRTIHLNTPKVNFKPNIDRHAPLFNGHFHHMDLLRLSTLFSEIPCILQTPHTSEDDRLMQINKGIKLTTSLVDMGCLSTKGDSNLFKDNNSAVVAQG